MSYSPAPKPSDQAKRRPRYQQWKLVDGRMHLCWYGPSEEEWATDQRLQAEALEHASVLDAEDDDAAAWAYLKRLAVLREAERARVGESYWQHWEHEPPVAPAPSPRVSFADVLCELRREWRRLRLTLRAGSLRKRWGSKVTDQMYAAQCCVIAFGYLSDAATTMHKGAEQQLRNVEKLGAILRGHDIDALKAQCMRCGATEEAIRAHRVGRCSGRVPTSDVGPA